MDHLLARIPFKPLSVIYTVLILLLVTLPINGDDQPLGQLDDTFILQIRLDYVSHALLFVPWTVLVCRGWQVSLRRGREQAAWLAGCLGFGVFCEYIQWPLTYRAFTINDLISNILGILLGFVFVRSWGRRKSDQPLSRPTA